MRGSGVGVTAGWVRIGAAALGGLVAGGVAAYVVATLRWRRATERALARLDFLALGGENVPRLPFSREHIAGLPGPVARYFDFALTPGRPLVRRAHIRWAGEFFTGSKWNPFTAEQHFSARPPGFVWDADIRMMPMLPVRVRDGYVAGEGAMLGKLAGLVSLVDQRGTPELAASALIRYLAEAVWFPTALLPNEGVSWTPVDDRTARASLTDGLTTVSVDFHFGERGEIVGVSAMRHRDVDGTPILTQWVGRYRDYMRADGMMIPTGGEVEWVLAEGPLPYWRGQVVAVNYGIARRR